MEVSSKHTKTHFLSVDLEDWYTSAYLRDYIKEGAVLPRIEDTTALILDLFESSKVKATFFILGQIAERHPELIKEISRKGHEIASHGYSHTPLWKLTPRTFEKEIQETNQILFDLTGKQIKGFRAPYASLDPSTAWAIDVLEDNDFVYDSSIFPLKTPLYGVSNAIDNIYRISSDNILQDNEKASMIEVPFTVYRSSLLKIPCTGGIYGRFLPLTFLLFLLSRVADKRPLNFYFHPWEIDSQIPEINVPLYNRVVTYYNTSSYLNKIEDVLDKFSFTSFEEKLKEISISERVHPQTELNS